MYTGARMQLVVFVKSPPLEPPSLWQQTLRNRFRLAGYTWRRLPSSIQEAWEAASKEAHLQITGYNLFLYWQLTKDHAAINTVERLSRIKLIPISYPPR